MSVRHVFSIEIEEFKREFIKSAHTPVGETPSFCLFGDVSAFEEDTAWCYTCNKKHSAALDVDVYFVGPSCKNVSYENANFAQYANCYENYDGCSGETYRLGVLKGIETTCPAVAFYENTKGVGDHVKDAQGVRHRPRIEAWIV